MSDFVVFFVASTFYEHRYEQLYGKGRNSAFCIYLNVSKSNRSEKIPVNQFQFLLSVSIFAECVSAFATYA